MEKEEINRMIALDFYLRDDVVTIARELLGKVLCTNIDGFLVEAVITETEAYAGVTDRASHAWNGRRTSRTGVMFREGGCAYVYLCYGIHSLFNIVTGRKDEPHAVLIRAGRVIGGKEVAMKRLGRSSISPVHTTGPGKLSKAMGIHYSLSGEMLTGNRCWLEDRQSRVDPHKIITTPRIGVDYAGDDAMLPYRFVLKMDNHKI